MTSFIQFVLESAGCLALFYLGYLLFLRKETYFKLNRVYLVLSIIVSFIVPAFKITSPVFTKKAVTGLHLYPMSVPAAKTWGLGETLLFIYAVGAGLFLTRFIFHMVKLSFVVKKYGIRRVNGVKIVSVDKDFSPFSFLNFVFINDRKITESNMRRIIAHESIHIKQHHTFDILLIELVTIVQWFNPFVWPYKKSLQETHEFLADCGVIAQGFSTAKYQLLMFEQHVGMKLFEFASNFKQSQIKRRITMMSKIKSRSAAKLKLLLVLPLASLLVLAFAEPRPADPQVAEALGADITGIKVTNTGAVNSGQEEEIKKKKLAQAEKELKMLYEKEKNLRKKLEKTKDPDKKAELKSSLRKVLEKQKVMEKYLKTGQLPPPPAPPKPADAPPPPPPHDQSKLKQEYKLLSEKAEAIKAKLAKVKDAEKKAELEHALQEVLIKQVKIEASMAEADGSDGSTLDKLKKEYTLLSEKAEQIKAKLAQTDDPDDKAKLKEMLADV
ncbi:MAG: M56 family metallopeptidase, partial [Candidatus Aminicenantes bacterium]